MKKKTSPMSLQEIDDMIELFLEQFESDGVRQHMASQIIVQSAIFGANNFYEAIGMIEDSKIRYREIAIDVLESEK